MADLGSQNNRITVNVSSGGSKTNINPTYNSTVYYSNIAKEWAISDQLVSGEDYSSKYYANESKKQAQEATDKAVEVTEIAETALSDINSAKSNTLTSISEQETITINNINTAGMTQVNLATQQASIATNKADEVVSIGNTAILNINTAKTSAITLITEQETTSKNNVINTGNEKIEHIQQEAQTQISNIEQVGFYMRGGELYYIDENGEEKKFVSDLIPLGYSLYQGKGTQPSTAWLASNGQWNDGNVYTTFYNYYANKIDDDFASGRIVESSATYTDYDLVINQDEMSFRLPLLDGSEVLPSNVNKAYSLPSTTKQKYTADYNGTVMVQANTTAANQYVQVKNVTSAVCEEKRNPITNNFIVVSVGVKKGDTFQISADVIKNITSVSLNKSQGNGTLYFKVASAV